jgi:alpha-mannosidase/mannosylglycerate hydrolase
MGGISGRRDADGNGLAFVSAYGLHECAAFDDTDGTLAVTLYRCFERANVAIFQEGGQLFGQDLTFKYALMPLRACTSCADIIRLQDCISAGVRAASFIVAEDYLPAAHKSYLEIEDGAVCMSILKRPENGAENSVIIRVYNTSDKNASARIKFFMNISSVCEVNMNEEFLTDLTFGGNIFTADLAAYKVKTFKISF